MIETTLVSGFLGAGKTTWLGHRLRHDGVPVDSLIVNDFAEDGGDDLLLRDAAGPDGPPVESLVGGCLCCERLDELTRLLHGVVGRHHRRAGADDGARHVIVETSGLAEPQRIVDAVMADPVLRTNLTLPSMIVVLDGLGGRRLLRHRPTVRDHVAIADRVVVTRTDLATVEEIEELAGTVRMLNVTAELVGAARGHEHAVRPVPPTAPDTFDNADVLSRVRSWTVRFSPGTNWAEYAVWLDAVVRAHPQRLLRTKGLVPTPDGPLFVQSMGPDVARPVPATDATGATGSSMVFIVDDIDLALLERSLRHFVPSGFADSDDRGIS